MTDRRAEASRINKFVISYDDLTFEKVIGTGGYAEVYLGQYSKANFKVAIKKLYATDDSPRTKELYEREVKILAFAQNRFLVPFVGFTNVQPYCIVTKYFPNGSLFNALHDEKKTLSPAEKTMIAYGIASGMKYLHDKEIIHRDLKTQNVLLDEDNVPIICDFGSSRIENAGVMTSSFGTPNYMAPEFIQGEEYTLSADVYSYGLILWEMLTESVPFSGMEHAQVIYRVIVMHLRPPIPEDVPDNFRKLIEYCWSSEKEERPPFSQIVTYFEKGAIEFPGCDQEEYQNLIKKHFPQDKTKRKNKDGNFSQNKKSEQDGVKAKLSSSVENLAKYGGSNEELLEKAVEHLNALDGNNNAAIRQALEFFELIAETTIILSIDFWPHFLNYFQNEHPPDIQSKAKALLFKVSSAHEILKMISNVKDLHKYFSPEILDLFLFIVTYKPNLINQEIINDLFQLFDSQKYGLKAITLICIFVQNSPKPTLTTEILNYLTANAHKYKDTIGAHLILNLLQSFNFLSDEVISLYGQSTIDDNVIAAYQALLTTSKRADLFSLSRILDNCLSKNEKLRNCALEFIRKFAVNADGEPLKRLAVALFETIFQYESEKAALLLVRISSNPDKCDAILKSSYIENFLNAKPSIALLLLKVFLTLIETDDRSKKFFFHQPVISKYFASVAQTGKEDAMICLCWALTKIKITEELALSLVNSGFMSILCKHAVEFKTTDERFVWLLSTIARISPLADCEEYYDVVKLLVNMVINKSPISHHCIISLASLSNQFSTVKAFSESNVSALFRSFNDNPDSKSYQVQIYNNLVKSGEIIP